MFTDTHCHVLKEYYDNFDLVIKNALNNNVNRMIISAYNEESTKEVIKIVKKYNNIYGVIGLHPENCLDEFDYNLLTKYNKIIGIGEIGLDYHYGKENIDKQKEIFNRQLSIATRLNLPVVIHSRDATKDTLDILKKYKLKGVIHSFSGSYETAEVYIKMGFVLGINGVVTFKNSNLKEVIKRLKPENIILETDSPYLTPVPKRGETNEPANVKFIAEFVSNIFKITPNELAEITNKTIKQIFDI